MTSFLSALSPIPKNKKTTPPLWMMRQAGRYLPEYRQLREKAGSFWNLCFNPELATTVTLQPIERFNYDAAIIFSDILVIPKALKQEVNFLPNHGPQLKPFDWQFFLNTPIQFDCFHQELNPIYQALHQTKNTLGKDKTLIGFSGTPWTLITYMLDLGIGKGAHKKFDKSINSLSNKNFIHPALSKIADAVSDYLLKKIEHGADVIQLFDSWASIVPPNLRSEILFNPVKKIIEIIHTRYPTIPIIYFGRGISDSYPLLLNDLELIYPNLKDFFILGIDQFTDINWVAKEIQPRVCVQGNLDPEILKSGGKPLEMAVHHILSTLSKGNHIFNLGHGILPETPIEHVEYVVKCVRSHGI